MVENQNGTSEKRIIRSTALLSASTFLSRILGFVREILFAKFLGGGLEMSAWVLAITLPNLARRVLGEGALGTAIVPIIAHSVEREGPVRARIRFGTILSWLTMLLAAITVFVSVPAYYLADCLPKDQEIWRLAAYLLPFVMPYSIFICSVGVMTSYANSLREYFLPSLTAIVQNLVMICGVYLVAVNTRIGLWFDSRLAILGFAVMTAGALELLLMVWVLHRRGVLPLFPHGVVGDVRTIKMVFSLALPGIIGASAVQASLIVDRAMAGWVGDYAPAALYYSDRLVFLPIGIFAVAFGTVSLSEMSHSAAREDYKEMISQMMFSLRSLLFVTIPTAVFIFMFRYELIYAIFKRGAFDMTALKETAYAMAFYALGIPFFCAYKITVTGFTARKDMKFPMKVSIIASGANIVLNLVLASFLRQGGIALATVISSLFGNTVLLMTLAGKFDRDFFAFGKFFLACFKFLVVSSVGGAASCFAVRYAIGGLDLGNMTTFSSIVRLVTGGTAFAIAFVAASFVFGLEEAKTVTGRFASIAKKFCGKKA